MNSTATRPLSQVHVDWLEARGLDPERAAAMGIYSAGPHKAGGPDGEVVPSHDGNVLVFPYFDGGVEVNAKFRAPHKKFYQRAKAKKTFWNSDILDDPALHDGRQALVITEGELDALAAIQAGHPWTVSVPDGAPADRDAHGRPIAMKPDSELDPSNDAKFEYVANNWARLENIKRIVIASDGDGPGERLRDELARRLGRVRCSFVEYSQVTISDGDLSWRPAKDLNEVLQHFGDEAVLRIIQDAKPYPIKGLFRLSQYPELPALETVSLGWPILDRHIRVFAGEFIVVTGIPGHGKALALDTIVPTPSGWTTMGELSVGDSVYADDGEICRVLRCSEVMHDRPCFKITFDDGIQIVADAEHQWLTTSEKARRSSLMAKRRNRLLDRPLKPHGSDQTHKRTHASVVTTAEIGRTLVSFGKKNHQVQLSGRVNGVPTLLPIEPYVLGAWLGDGTSDGGSITAFDMGVLESIEASGSRVKAWRVPGRYNIEELSPKLRLLGLLKNKHIPSFYLRAPIRARLRLLNGLMDTDGSCRRRDRICEYTSVNRRLADGVFELVSSLGIKPTWIEGDAKLNGRIVSRKYRVCFMANFPVFSLQRKISNQRIGKPQRINARIVISCDPVPSVAVRCIQVDSASHLFLVSRGFVPTHNSTWVLNVLANLAESSGWPAAIFSPEMRTVPMLRDKLRKIRLRKTPINLDWQELALADQWINRNFVFIDADPTGREDEDPTLEWIIDRARDAVVRDGIRTLVIDPWNEVEHARAPGESMADYIGRGIRALKKFGQQYGVIVIVIVHPTKEVGREGKARQPTLYDCSDSAHWFNKPDHGVVVWRPGDGDEVHVRIAKVRFDESGVKGHVRLKFDAHSSRYECLDAGGSEGL